MFKANLSGFTPSSLYNEYDNCVDYLTKNHSKLFSNLDTTIDFDSISIDTTKLSSILSVLLNGQKTKVLDVYKVDNTLFPTKSVEKMSEKFDKFINIPKDINFKVDKFKGRKNDKEISYGVSSIEELTDQTIKTELTNVNARKITKPIDSKLNFYKP